MAFQRPFLISLRREDSREPWGFRLKGGGDLSEPVVVQQVLEKSLAERSGLHEGDELIQVGRINVQSLGLAQVHNLVQQCNDRVEMFVIREDLLRNRKENEPSTLKAVTHSSYNSPFQLYSPGNVADTLATQTIILTDPKAPLNHLGPASPPVVPNSDVLKFLREAEYPGYIVNGHVAPPPPRTKQPPPVPPKPGVARVHPPSPQPSPLTPHYAGRTPGKTEQLQYENYATYHQEKRSTHRTDSYDYESPSYQQSYPQESQSEVQRTYRSQTSFTPQQSTVRSEQSFKQQSGEDLSPQQFRTQQEYQQQLEQQRLQQIQEQRQAQLREQERQQEIFRQRQAQIREQEAREREQREAQERQRQISQRQAQEVQERQRQQQASQRQAQEAQERQRQQQASQRQAQEAQERQRQQQASQRQAQESQERQRAFEEQRQAQLRAQQAQEQQRRQQQAYEQQQRQQQAQQRQAYEDQQRQRQAQQVAKADQQVYRRKNQFEDTASHQKLTSTARMVPSPLGSPVVHRRGGPAPAWPPKNSSVRELPKTGFSPSFVQERGSKQFVWPPAKPWEEQDNSGGAGIPMGHGAATNAWHPQESAPSRALVPRSPTPTRRCKDIPWPPPHSIHQDPLRPVPKPVTRRGRFDNYIVQQSSSNVPPTYRLPPGTTHVEFA